ncbi:MAG TPA: DUF4091 domain-containing protein, partial [Parafilimonas sp.]|nr:DUF4091 domain-containing protein [Parafilimonas sp.]
LINFIKSIDNDWKISFSGKYYPEIQDNIYDYSLISNQQIPAGTINERRSKGFITTFYTSCWERFPNTFVTSDPVDATWLGWNAANRNMDGYLRYAYDYWTMKNILFDVRSNIATGDRFLVYPYGNSSIRFEMLNDGIEDFEKIHIKKNQGNLSGQFNSVLSQLDFKKAGAIKDRSMEINNARQTLNN